MSKVELARAYDALQQADAAGNKEDAQQLADYIRELEAKELKNEETDAQIVKDQKFDETASDPFTYGLMGAGAGLVAGPTLTKGVDIMTPTPLKPGAAPIVGPAVSQAQPNVVAKTPFNPRGVSVEQSVDNWRTYSEAQNEAAKGIRRDTALAKKYPNFERNQTTPTAIPPKLTPQQKATMMMQSPTASPPSRMGQMYGAGMAAGQGADAYSQARQGNLGQAAISGIGSVGGVASMSSNPKLRLLGRAVTTAAPILRSMTAPEEKAMGGVVGYAKGKAVKGGLEAVKKLLSPAGKSGAQVSREASYVHDVRPSHKFSDTNKLSIEDLQGSVLVGVPGDRSLTGHTLYSVNGVPLAKPTELFGGPRYGQRKADLGENSFWASQQGAASAFQNKVARAAEDTGMPVHGIYTAMAPDSSNYALHHTESLLNQLDALNPRKKDVQAFDKIIRSEYPAFFGLNDPDVMEQLRMNPEMRKLIAERLNKRSISEVLGLPSGEATTHAITEPRLRDVATGTSGFSVGKLDPHAKLSMDIAGDHPTYNTKIPGEFRGEMIAQLPWQEYFPDVAKQIASNPKQAPHAFGTFKMGQFYQPVNQELVDRIAPLEEILRKGAKKAEGGPIQGYAAGKKVIDAGLNFLKPSAKSHSQDPKVARALEEYLKGNISQEERIAIMNKQLPLRPWTEMPPAYTDEQIKMALMENKRPKALADVPAGARVGNRLDIPAYTQHGVYVDTTHDLAKGNSPISYNRTGHLKDVEFSSKPNQAVRVGLGTKEQALTPMGAEMGSAKSPFALIKGTNQGTSDEEVRRMMAELMKDPNYAQIGMDPRRHSQFYDKSTGMPVWAAEEKLQSGPLILVPKRGLETTSWDDPRLSLSDFEGKKYAKGGSTTPAWQRAEGKNPEGGLNAAGRASYNRETGGNLKAPQPEGGPRKKSFCARMEGMKKKNTSSATAKDPDSRINKSLRKWKC